MHRRRAARKNPPIPIQSDVDILLARRRGRVLAQELGMSATEQTVVATVISELSRNILLYAQTGMLSLETERLSGRRGLVIVAKDRGPGIRDIEQALQVGFSTSRSLGLGLPGVKRLMDEFEIVSKRKKGTIVTARKWKG
jgi:serine/threonine-protein kinase RsbT